MAGSTRRKYQRYAARSGAKRGVVNSSTTKRAPGRSTRCASRSPASKSARFRIPNATIAPSKRRSGNGSTSASAATGRVRGALSLPRWSIGTTKSAPITRPEKRGSRADRKSTRLNSSHVAISYAVFCLKKKNLYEEAECILDRGQENHNTVFLVGQIGFLE